jgi:hypothetical protein
VRDREHEREDHEVREHERAGAAHHVDSPTVCQETGQPERDEQPRRHERDREHRREPAVGGEARGGRHLGDANQRALFA